MNSITESTLRPLLRPPSHRIISRHLLQPQNLTVLWMTAWIAVPHRTDCAAQPSSQSEAFLFAICILIP